MVQVQIHWSIENPQTTDQKDSLERTFGEICEEANLPLGLSDSSLIISSGGAEVYPPEEQVVGLASSFMSRGRSTGYGLYFSKTRIIGVRKRRTSLVFGLALTVPLFALLLYLNIVFGFSGPFYATFLLLLFPVLFDQLVRRLRHVVPERIMRKSSPATTGELGSKIDFELRREEISELLMRHVSGGKLSPQPGYLRITPMNHHWRPIEIKIHGVKQFQTLREMVIDFAARQPQVRALEY